MVSQDVPPYCIATGDRAHLNGLNLIGLKRRGFTSEEITALKKAYRTLFAEGLPLKEAILRLREEYGDSVAVAHLTAFIAESQRGVCRPRGTADPEGGEESV
jgi:UDP-N-acetylglucosamine acyltransferase